ncbi:MAG: Gfo/Idh/MocA family oxidoreductase [Clostridiales bacterium]|jgi:predicted dehydrogenase|nr:Gfo/Idh/MocA family oxidoreductase [Clostridiales bacterium]
MSVGKLKYGMIGGDIAAFIGGVHRTAISFSAKAELSAGCFSIIPELNAETGRLHSVDPSRVYETYQEMIDAESKRSANERLDFVSIVTPNNTHYDIAKRCLKAGFNVYCEKPVCVNLQQAEELSTLIQKSGLLFGVNYSYTGYTMIKLAKEMVRTGKLGKVIGVQGQYMQEWLIDQLGDTSDTARLSAWRMDPEISGGTNCIGDIGTHLENMIAYITGLRMKKLCAKLDRFGHPLDFHGNIMLEFDNGATGVYTCSQVCIGQQNGFTFRIMGTEGSLEWNQQHPEELVYCAKGGAAQILTRAGGYLKNYEAASWSRIPAGHPEGLYEAFANMYKAFMDDIEAVRSGNKTVRGDYPTISEGIDGLRFVRAVLKSDAEDSDWVEV